VVVDKFCTTVRVNGLYLSLSISRGMVELHMAIDIPPLICAVDTPCNEDVNSKCDGQHIYNGRIYTMTLQKWSYMWPYYWLPGQLMIVQYLVDCSKTVCARMS
jgi:hypothetical protein